MAGEHQKIHQVVTPENNRPSLFDNVLLIAAELGAGSQCVLLSKVVLIDRDIAIAGFSFFFLAIFGIAYLISLRKALLGLIRWTGILVPILAGVASMIVFICLQQSVHEWFASGIMAMTLSLLLSFTSFLCAKGGKDAK